MVNSISTVGTTPVIGTSRPAAASQGGGETVQVATPDKQVPAEVAKAATPAPVVSMPSANLAPPLTSLALYKDSESGMQVSVVRDRVSGQVVEQLPTERARRIAAMVRQQDMLAQELHAQTGDMPHIDLKT